jgi:hypothetical protein
MNVGDATAGIKTHIFQVYYHIATTFTRFTACFTLVYITASNCGLTSVKKEQV